MRLVRTILVALITVAVAAVPAGAGSMASFKTSEKVAAHTGHLAAMPDCDHHAPARDHGSKPANDCASMAACAANCFNYAGTAVPAVMPAPATSRLQPIAAADLVVSMIGSPPFRPPRV